MDRAWAYALVYNEAPLIAYWVRHYLSFCEKAILYVDVDTDDGTAEIAEAEGALVRPWDGHGIGLDDDRFVCFANDTWPESTGHAQWVIWVDADEFLFHPHLIDRLDTMQEQGVTVPSTDYYVMVSENPPL